MLLHFRLIKPSEVILRLVGMVNLPITPSICSQNGRWLPRHQYTVPILVTHLDKSYRVVRNLVLDKTIVEMYRHFHFSNYALNMAVDMDYQ